MQVPWVIVTVGLTHLLLVRSDQTDFNHINSDGSFAFGLKNSDTPGGHYHTASGNPKTVVRGRYGSRQPDTGRVEETIYTAGPRGFRARGPKIHRKQSLSQVPRGPIGTPDDPQADPYDDPSYDFQFKTRNYQRREGSDSNGRVNGLYSYIDDVGEKHSVRYSAGSGTGYEVANPVPDAPNTIAYESPLYKTHKQVRGKVAFESGPSGSGQYKLLSVGPDQRRAETTGPDGVTRGSYSYLDDKGVQRTVQYIAGAGIGYKVVQSTTGAGTHRLPQPAFGIAHVEQSDIADNNNPAYQGASSGPTSERPGTGGGYDHVARPSSSGYDGPGRPTAPDGYDPPTGPSGPASGPGVSGPGPSGSGYPDTGRPGTGLGYDEENFDSKRPTTPASVRPATTDRPDAVESSREKYPPGGPGDDPDHELGGYGDDSIIGLVPPKYDFESAPTGPVSSSDDQPLLSGPFDVAISSGPSGPAPYPSFGESAPDTNAYNSNDFASFPEVSYDQKKLQDDRKKDWRDFAKDSTIIKNVGDWYVGLAPGASVRAHVQSIDLLPYGGRAPSPGDALRRDTQAQAKSRPTSDGPVNRKTYERR
ncbi:collagen alpha-1(I) chain [Anopheles bellator]|uniref:collagen alpha-1(I) chain n=1 Tax=Anopheles bellator TaxID=139047 RepID=UPI002647F81A|nr:collagen alpha-1(I) chain [Anopheles bellator]